MKKLICILVATIFALTFTVGAALAAGRKKAPPTKTQIAEVDQLLQAAKNAIRTGEQIKRQVIASGGTEASSTNYAMRGTAGQTAVGAGSSDNYGLSHGYWQTTGGGGPPTCCMAPIRGNVDYDGGDQIDISDLVYLVDYMFTGGPPPPCFSEADIDGSSGGESNASDIDISDLVYLVDYMFTGGPPPLAC